MVTRRWRMLNMTQIHQVRQLYFNEGRTISEIYRETKVAHKTIRTYIEKDDWNTEKEVDTQIKSAFSKLDKYKPDINEWLTSDKKAKRKQRHTAKRIFVRLKEKYPKEFECSYRTVAGYFAKKKKEIFGKKDAYLPLEHIPGEAQADFGNAEYYENGKLYNGNYLNLSFPYSNQGYFQLFKGENQECLFEGLIAIFEHIGGVPQKIWFDNASTMVTKILKNGERNLTDGFLRFVAHYRFEYAFCNANAGHEKGNIEGKVGYHRRNMLVPIPTFTKLAIFNAELLEKCDLDANREHYRKDATIKELHDEDRLELLELPTVPLEVSKYQTLKTNGYGRFYLNSGLHEYSVSPKYANCRTLIKITANEVIPLDENYREIVRHERLYGEGKQQSMQWLPYLTQLSHRPGALKYTGIYEILPDAVKDYLDKCNKSDKGKVLKTIAHLTEKSGFENAVASIEKMITYDVVDADSLINLHNRIHADIVDLPPLHLSDNVPALDVVKINLAAYDVHLTKAGATLC